MASYRKMKVNEIGTDTYIDQESHVSCSKTIDRHPSMKLAFFSFSTSSSINEFHVRVPSIRVRRKCFLVYCFSLSSTLSLSLFLSLAADLCAISYDNGHIRLFSTFNNQLKLVKGNVIYESVFSFFFSSLSLCHVTIHLDHRLKLKNEQTKKKILFSL